MKLTSKYKALPISQDHTISIGQLYWYNYDVVIVSSIYLTTIYILVLHSNNINNIGKVLSISKTDKLNPFTGTITLTQTS
jgi:hypothetical protein